jgi:hypothetical protein
MDPETQKIIDDQVKTLPADVKAAIISVDYKTKLQEITKRQRLLIDQAAKLEMETTLVMIGLEPLADYIKNLERELGIDSIRAKALAMDVSENIFKPIRESLKKINESLSEEDQGDPEPGEEELTKFTNTNEIGLNRDQILKEIENPSLINHQSSDSTTNQIKSNPETQAETELEIRPAQELETVPGQTVKDIARSPIQNITTGEVEKPTVSATDILKMKMTQNTVIPQQTIEAKPETKLPEVKKRPSSSFDPYREPIQ